MTRPAVRRFTFDSFRARERGRRGRAFSEDEENEAEGCLGSAVLVIPHFCLTDETLRLVPCYRLCHSGVMPQGKHKGARVVLTLDHDAYARWQAHAAALGLPTATLLRQLLEMSEPVAAEMVAQLDRIRQPDSTIDEVLGPILMRTLRNLDKND